jgi:hypothetical protein
MDMLMNDESEESFTVYDFIIGTVAIFSLQLVVGVSEVVAERDADNAATEELPPVLPIDLCNTNGRLFSAALLQQNTRLKHTYTDYDILVIDQQFRDLRIAYREEEGLSHALENAHCRLTTQSFHTCWTPLGSRFLQLRNFCAGLASVMPGTATVEADFSIINWTKDSNSKHMTDFTLESILHCKQYKRIQKLFE